MWPEVDFFLRLKSVDFENFSLVATDFNLLTLVKNLRGQKIDGKRKWSASHQRIPMLLVLVQGKQLFEIDVRSPKKKDQVEPSIDIWKPKMETA